MNNLIAFKGFRYQPASKIQVLRSPMTGDRWEDHKLTAVCGCRRKPSANQHRPNCKCPRCVELGPQPVFSRDVQEPERHRCGIYAGTVDNCQHYGNVLAVVSAEGPTMLHSMGYRCLGTVYVEFIVAINYKYRILDRTHERWEHFFAEKAAHSLGLPLLPFPEAREMVAESIENIARRLQ